MRVPALPVRLAIAAMVISSPPTVSVPILSLALLKSSWTSKRRKKNSSAHRRSERSTATLADDGSFQVVPVLLTWHAVSVTRSSTKAKKKQSPSQVPSPETRVVLSKASGVAKPGELHAIMGPSGAGKTTLMNAIAGQVPASKLVRVTGVVKANGTDTKVRKPHIAYVQQKDVFFANLTARETLELAARMHLPKSWSEERKMGKVDELVQQLGLRSCLDTMMGDGVSGEGVSGGERKRVAIAVKLLHDLSISVLFLDEPTTGLDSFSSLKVMQVLKDLAASGGMTVVVTIHQPRSSVFALFDRLTVVSELGVAYSGPASDAALALSDGADRVAEAELVVDAISIDHANAQTEEASRTRVAELVAKANARAAKEAEEMAVHASTVNGIDAPTPDSATAHPWTAFRLLLGRSWKQVARDKKTNKLRAMTMLNSAMVFGSIYWRMGKQQNRIQDRFGLLQVCSVNAAMASITKTLTAFSKERQVIQRERASSAYPVVSYFVSKLAAETPVSAAFPLVFSACVYPMCGLNNKLARFATFAAVTTLESFTSSALGLAVGALTPSPEAANALGPAIMVIFIVFGGLYVQPANVPAPLRWIPNTSLIRHCFDALSCNEMRGLEFETERPTDLPTGDAALERFGLGDATVAKSSLRQARLLLFYWYSAGSILSNNKPRFADMLDE